MLEVPQEREYDAVNQWDVAEKIKEVLMPRVCRQSGDHCWFPNRSGDYPREFRVDELDEGACVLTGDMVMTDLLWLENEFRGALLVLGEVYGPGAVRPCWGLFVEEGD